MADFPAPFPSDRYSLRFYETGTATTLFADRKFAFAHPEDIANGMTVAKARQAWSQGIRVQVSNTSGDYLEYSFDGVNVHGRIGQNETDVSFIRMEGGIAVRGQGTFWIEAW